MLDLTPIARPVFSHRVKAINRWRGRVRSVQEEQLLWLLSQGRRTLYGESLGMGAIKSYDVFKQRVPVVEYPDIRPAVMRMLRGERSVLWPGRCRHFAQSSGTSDGKSKYIPITADSFSRNHYPGASDAVALYLHSNPESHIFGGKAFILGGSFANELPDVPRNVTVGDLSANLIANINPVVNLLRVPRRKVALMEDWSEKLPALVSEAADADISNISGVPSWFLTVLERVLQAKGASCIHDVWPNLEVFFHGGISFEPYRATYARITDPQRMHYVENYNASEGFFAAQDSPDILAMLLLLDRGVFFEFVPLDEVGEVHPQGAVPAWEVEEGKVYALIISACNGLWRYAIGDTVRIHSTDPLRITIAGRTKHYINAFGEELMVHNADAAITEACAATGASVLNYTAAPVMAAEGHKGHHQWLIEWGTPPADISVFARLLDQALQRVNSDYQAKRSGDIFLAGPEIVSANPGLFDSWLAATGKLGGQRKVPRLSNDRSIITAIMALQYN